MTKQRDGVWIIDADGNTLFASERMAEILESTPMRMIGRSSFEHIFPEDQDEARRLFEGKKRGDLDPFTFRLRTDRGKARWVEVQGTPMHDASGKFKGVVGTFTPTESPA